MDNKIETTIYLSREVIYTAWTFAEQVIQQQSSLDFGSGNERKAKDQIADTVAGKLGEFAFREFLRRNFGIIPEVDISIYEGIKSTDDGNDINCFQIGNLRLKNHISIDVKTSKGNAQVAL